MRNDKNGRLVSGNGKRAAGIALLALAVPVLSGCSERASWDTGWLPSESKGLTNHTDTIIELWNGSWIAAMFYGVLVWGLMLWAMVVYRRRKNDPELPLQVRYNVPLEIFYTVVPTIMIAGLFIETVKADASIVELKPNPDVTINVVGKQWAWDFNYTDAGVYETSVQVDMDGEELAPSELPTLYLPVGENIQFDLQARDVIHSFWIPAFLYKEDMIPGRTNRFQVVPQRTGTFAGKCAELCGEYHSAMLFQVKVVERAEFDAHMEELRAAGNVGSLDVDLGRSDLINAEGDN